MKKVKGFLGLLWKIYFLFVFTSTLLLLYPIYFVWLQNERYFDRGFRLIRRHVKLMLFLVGVRRKVYGNIPMDKEVSYIICPNHSSYLDIMMLYAVLPNYFIFLGKKELGKVPVFNIFFKKMNILIDRQNPKAAYESIEKAQQEMKKGRNVVVFPEGTISANAPQMRPFKNGAFKLALQLQMPILPITFANNYTMLQDKRGLGSKNGPGVSKIYIHPPIQIKLDEPQDLLTLREQTRVAIQSKL